MAAAQRNPSDCGLDEVYPGKIKAGGVRMVLVCAWSGRAEERDAEYWRVELVLGVVRSSLDLAEGVGALLL